MSYEKVGYECIPSEKLKACTEFYSVDQPIAPAYKIQIGDRFHFNEDDSPFNSDNQMLFQLQGYCELKHISDSYYNYEVIGFK